MKQEIIELEKQKEAVKASEIVRIPLFPSFSWSGLSEFEQEIFRIFKAEEKALNSMQVYFMLARRLTQKKRTTKGYVSEIRKEANILDLTFLPKDMQKKFMNLESLKRVEAEELILELRKSGIPIPSYNTIKSRLGEFVQSNYLGQRGFGTRSYFYLPESLARYIPKD